MIKGEVRSVDANKRRQMIEDQLEQSTTPIKGSQLAKDFSVSRQVIVQDIALLRAKGVAVVATPSGYMIQTMVNHGLLKTICCQHGDSIHELEQELSIIISYGGKVIDVVVEHQVYGEIRAVLNLTCLNDVNTFIEKTKKSQTKPLSLLTEGIHYHTLEVTSEKMFSQIVRALAEHDYLG